MADLIGPGTPCQWCGCDYGEHEPTCINSPKEQTQQDTITVNRAALVALVKAAKQVLDADVWWKTEGDLRAALAPFADLQE